MLNLSYLSFYSLFKIFISHFKSKYLCFIILFFHYINTSLSLLYFSQYSLMVTPGLSLAILSIISTTSFLVPEIIISFIKLSPLLLLLFRHTFPLTYLLFFYS